VIITSVFFIGLIYQSSYAQIDWKNYTSEKYGISLQVPVNWNITEKQNRFINPNGALLETTNPSSDWQWLGIQDIPLMNQTVNERGLLGTISIMMQVAINNDNTLIEGIDMTTYKIDGHRTGTFLVANNNFVDKTFMLQVNNGDGYMIRYQNTPELFDSPESREILNKMINSINFLS